MKYLVIGFLMTIIISTVIYQQLGTETEELTNNKITGKVIEEIKPPMINNDSEEEAYENESPTENTTLNITKETTNDTTKSKDTDGGKNYYVKGTGTSNKGIGWIYGFDPNKESSKISKNLEYDIYNDHCYNSKSSNILKEAYIDENGTIQYSNYECPKGCKEGACITDFEIYGNEIRLKATIKEGEAKIDVISGDGTRFTKYGDIDKQLVMIKGANPTIYVDKGEYFILSDITNKESHYLKLTEISDKEGADFMNIVTKESHDDIEYMSLAIGNASIKVYSRETINKTAKIKLNNAYSDRIYTKDGREIVFNIEELPSPEKKMWINEPDGTKITYHFAWKKGKPIITNITVE